MVLLVDIYTGSVATMTNLVVINAAEPASLSLVPVKCHHMIIFNII